MLIYNETLISEDAITMEDLDETSIYIGKDGFIGNTSGTAIYGYSSDITAYIAGTVVGANRGLWLGSDDMTTTGDHVKIFKTGSIFSPRDALTIYGGNEVVENAGNITCELYSAVVVISGTLGDGSVVINSGSISAGTVGAGVYFGGEEDGKLVNSGRISGGNSAFNSINSTGDMTVVNTGTLSGGILFGSGKDIYQGAGGKVVDGVISPGAGNDILTGGKGSETFVFHEGNDRDTITNFAARGKAHDFIDLTGSDALDTFGDIRDHATQHGKDLWISDGAGDLLILKDLALKDLTAQDFIF